MNRKSAIRNLLPSAVATGALLAAVSAHAALPAGATAFFTSVSTDFGDLLTAAYPVLIVITGGMIIMGLVKKVAKKAAS